MLPIVALTFFAHKEPTPMEPTVPERQLTELDLSRLAREIARQLKPLETILEQNGIQSDQFNRIKENPIFLTRMGEEAALWSASTAKSIRERISIKAAIAVEELLQEAVDIVQDKKLGGAARIQGLQFIAKMGQLGEGNMTKDDASGKVQINIILGDRKVTFEQEHEPKTLDVTPEVEAT